MIFVEHEGLYAALIAMFAALAVFVGGCDIPAVSEKQNAIKG